METLQTYSPRISKFRRVVFSSRDCLVKNRSRRAKNGGELIQGNEIHSIKIYIHIYKSNFPNSLSLFSRVSTINITIARDVSTSSIHTWLIYLAQKRFALTRVRISRVREAPGKREAPPSSLKFETIEVNCTRYRILVFSTVALIRKEKDVGEIAREERGGGGGGLRASKQGRLLSPCKFTKRPLPV